MKPKKDGNHATQTKFSNLQKVSGGLLHILSVLTLGGRIHRISWTHNGMVWTDHQLMKNYWQLWACFTEGVITSERCQLVLLQKGDISFLMIQKRFLKITLIRKDKIHLLHFFGNMHSCHQKRQELQITASRYFSYYLYFIIKNPFSET